jgi:pimeloyl-ACP methyl ester carboxylesterase
MPTVTSKDGTTIAYDQTGSGPAVILVGGAFNTRSFGPNGPLTGHLAKHCSVINYDRRGRGESGDTAPYTVEREIEDLASLITAAGGRAGVYGISSGAALALEAAQHGLGITKLALFEAPYIVDASRPPVPADYQEHLRDLIAAERRGEAVTYFMRAGIGLPALVVTLMRFMPAWAQLKAVAPSLLYDVALMVDDQQGKPLSINRWTSVTMPTLVLCGGKSPPWMQYAMQALSDVLPNAQHASLPGQTHIVKPEALAPVLVEFFKDSRGLRKSASVRSHVSPR